MSLPAKAPQTQARRPARYFTAQWIALALLTFGSVGVTTNAGKCPEIAAKDQPHIRWPVASAWMDWDRRLVLANRCGTLSIVDFQQRKVVEELPVGSRLADIVRHPSGRWWLTVDEKGNELIVLGRVHNSLKIQQRHTLKNPTRIACSYRHERVAVASLWSRTVTIFESIQDPPPGQFPLKKLATLRVSFNPGKLAFRDDERGYLVVHDAFAAGSALIHTVAPLPLVLSDTHERGDRPGPYDESMNSYRWTNMFTFQNPGERIIADGRERFTFEDTPLEIGPSPNFTPAQRGELLFRKRLNGWQSCHSCHRDGHTSYQLADTLADNTTKTPKRIPTLLGTRLTDPWAWNGRFRNLDEQVRSSLETTMHVQNVTPDQIADLTAYLHTLPPPPPLEPATDDPRDQEMLARGKGLFTNLGCAKCHVPPLTYTSPDAYDVGLADEAGLTKFNPPSLRGVSQGYSFFHDGRVKTLEEVFTIHGHQLPRDLEKQELSDLLRFLRSL